MMLGTVALQHIGAQQTVYLCENIGYNVSLSHLPYAILQRYHTLRSAIGKLYNLYYRSVRRRVARAQLHQIRTVYLSRS